MRRAIWRVSTLALCLFAATVAVDAAETRSDISPATVQYLALRRASPPTSGLTLAVLAQNPRLYRKQTLEISGKLIGVCSRRRQPNAPDATNRGCGNIITHGFAPS